MAKITHADVGTDLTGLYVRRSPELHGSIIVKFDPRAKHDWEAHGSCVSVTVIIRTSPFDPHFACHVNRAYRAACLLYREQTQAHTIREH